MEPDLTAKEVEAKFWHDRADTLEAAIEIWRSFNADLLATHTRLIQERDEKIELLTHQLKEARGVLRDFGVT